MIISASRRTDIPAFYSDWFYERIKEKYVLVRNPLNIHQSYNNILRFDNVTKRPITEDQPKIARDNKISKVERS